MMQQTMHKDTLSSSSSLRFDWRPSSDHCRFDFDLVIMAESSNALILKGGKILLFSQRKILFNQEKK